MNIGIDIDDTISNSFESVFTNAQKSDIEFGNSGDPKKYGKIADHNYIETMYPDWSKEQTDLFWERYFIDMLTIATPKDEVAEILKKLKQEGNNIIIITSRYEFEEDSHLVQNYTQKWLEKNNIVYDKLVMNAQNKLNASKENDVEMFIDDSVAHCRNVQSGGIITFLYTSTCNQAVEANDLQRVYSWPQIYDKYKKIRQNSCKIPTKLIY